MDVFATISIGYVVAGLALVVFIAWLVSHRLKQMRMRNRPDAPISPPSANAGAHPVERR